MFWKLGLFLDERLESLRRVIQALGEDRAASRQQRQALAQFRCHVCGRKATRPYVAPDQPELSPEERKDYNRPGDLSTCKRCGKYACSRHIYRYKGELICKSCGQDILKG
ncbi:MAG: hypothetical protein JW900_15035 [Anaerolineae bacterium]|nr:hypothetical protein [Anaerolineae bacterium]